MPVHSLGAPPRVLLAATSVAAGLTVLAACGGNHSATVHTQTATDTGSAAVGDLHVTGAYVPLNASPSVAAAYFTVTDSGAADALLSVSSPVSSDIGLHRTVETGTTGEMVPVSSLPVSTDAALHLQPGGYHVMLMNPATLKVGQTVVLTLHFAHAGAVTVDTPVVPLTGRNDDSSTVAMTSGAMTGMS